MNADSLLAVFLSLGPGAQPVDGPTHLRGGVCVFPCLTESFWKYCHRLSQRHVILVILNSITLTMTTHPSTLRHTTSYHNPRLSVSGVSFSSQNANAFSSSLKVLRVFDHVYTDEMSKIQNSF